MGVNKVVFGAVSIMDISDSTVTPEKLAKGATAYAADGEKITGTMEAATDPVLQEKTVTPKTSSQSVTPDSGYDGLSKVTVNAMPTATQATPSISVSSGGLITASATQTAGYVAAGTKSATKQLTVQAAQTITPSTADKTIASGRYLTGTQTIKGDANLTAANIAKGKTIFGVTGTHEGGEDVSAETAEYTAQLDELEEVIDGLPEAGGGGGGGGSETTVDLLDTSVSVFYTEELDGGSFLGFTEWYQAPSGNIYNDAWTYPTEQGSDTESGVGCAVHKGATLCLLSKYPREFDISRGAYIYGGDTPDFGFEGAYLYVISISYDAPDEVTIHGTRID